MRVLGPFEKIRKRTMEEAWSAPRQCSVSFFQVKEGFFND
jgi:hypothetical protein